MFKPKILIIAEDGYAKNIPHFMINLSYGKGVSNAGGLPLVALNTRLAEDYAEMCDGLLLVDGPEIHRDRYKKFYHSTEALPDLSREREAMEWKLCELMTKKEKPIMGIGRGMQLLNVFFGGTLQGITENLDLHIAKEDNKTVFTEHTVSFTKESRFFNTGSISVNSAHHQAIKDLGEDIVAVATSYEGTIEACEHKTLPFFGVQWHPELLEDGKSVFDKFIELCEEGIG